MVKKFGVNDSNFAPLTLILLLHHPQKCKKIVVWLFTTMYSY